MRVLLMLLCSLCSLAVQAQPRIGVLTMQPGAVFWERFGHNAIVVHDPAKGGPISYNYGFFDMGEPGFSGRFIAGDPQYSLVPLPLQDDLQNYRDEGRGVKLQWLDLTPAQASAMQAALEKNALPENQRYRYDYFRNNCTTRVRDVIDATLGGSLRKQLETGSNGETYRSDATRLAAPARWMRIGMELGLGPAADVPLTHWDDAFLPERLFDSLARAKGLDGRPLVSATEDVLPHRLPATPAETRLQVLPFLLAGLVLGALILWMGRRHRRVLAGLALPFWLLSGLLGCVMLYGWLGTQHWVMAANRNLFVFSPLTLLLAWPAVQWLRGRDSRMGRSLLMAIAALAVLGLLVLWLAPSQRNGAWIALLLPVHLALAAAFTRAPLARTRV